MLKKESAAPLPREELEKRLAKAEAELKKSRKRSSYGLVWEDKEEDVISKCAAELPVLREEADWEIHTDDNAPYNIIIEGDNYHALCALNFTHKKKIDVIYIDPPYNTGNKSWKYNNDYVDSEDRYRHSKWLSFMNHRLRLAKELLKDSGIIICAIDDYEFAGLKLLMDTIFGEHNRLGTVVVVHNPRGRSDDLYFATCHEYLLIYSKNCLNVNTHNLRLTEEQAEDFPYEDELSFYRLLPLKRTGSNSTPLERPNLYYPIYYNQKLNDLILKKKTGYIEIVPIDSDGNKRVWRWGKQSFIERKDTEIVVKNNNDSNYSIFTKDRIKYGRKPKTVWQNA